MADGSKIPRFLRLTPFKVAIILATAMSLAHFLSYADGHPEDSILGILEAKALDAKFRVRGKINPSGRVTVVAVDERSLAEYGRWPWSRDVMARLINALTDVGVRVIALDMAFTEPDTAGRHVALKQAYEKYLAEVEADAPTGEGTLEPTDTEGEPVVSPKRAVAYEKWLKEAIDKGDPDAQLAKAIFESGRVVWGLFGHSTSAGSEAKLEQAHFDEAFAQIEPFTIHELYEVRVDDFGDLTELPDEGMSVDDDRFEPTSIDVGLETPLPRFTAATPFFGLMNVAPDPDGVLRRADLVARHNGVLVPSLSLAAVAAYLNSRIYPIRDEIKERRLGKIRLRVGSAENIGQVITDAHGAIEWLDTRPELIEPGPWEEAHLDKWNGWLDEQQAKIDEIPIDAEEVPELDPVTIPGFEWDSTLEIPLDPDQHGRVMVNHQGRAVDFPTVGVKEVIEGTADPELLEDRIALVGVTAIGTFDQRVTPFDGFIPGVFVQAALMDGMLTKRSIHRPWWMVIAEIGLLFFLSFVVAFVLPRMNNGVFIVLFIAAGVVGYGLVDLWLFSTQGVDLFVITPMATFAGVSLSLAVYQWIVVDREKRHVRKAFQQYLAPAVMEAVLDDPSKLALDPARAELTVLFSDIRGFTTISERLTPEQLANVLNEYLTPMTNVVFDHGGTLDKYMGDAIMAFWGDPVPQEDHALRACDTALVMMEKCRELGDIFEERGWPRIDIGIGINTGILSVGNFGSNVLFDYTVMGDSVNLGSRLEGINKQYGTHIIISEFTLKQCEGKVVVRELDSVRVKGKLEPVRIFELRGLGQADEAEQAFLDAFAEAILRYKNQLWDDAIAQFEECLKMVDDDYTSQMYISRCADMRADPPGEDWDGVYTMKTK